MNWRNYKTLIIGGGLCLVLLLVGVFLLFNFSGKHAATQAEVDSGISRLKALKGAPVFPAAKNVAVLKENIKKLETFRADYVSTVSADQIEPEAMSGTDFLKFYETIRGGLMTEAARVDLESGKTEIKFPEYFGFGFEAYQKGGRPGDEFVPRLTVQLKTMDALCRMFFEAGVTEITQLQREVFEMAQENVEDSRRRPKAEKTEAEQGALFEEEKFTIALKTREENLWAVMDALASKPMSMVINKMSVKNGNTALLPKFEKKDMEGIEGEESAPTRRSSRRRRPVKKVAKVVLEPGERTIEAGNEGVELTLDLSVYRFNNEASAETGE